MRAIVFGAPSSFLGRNVALLLIEIDAEFGAGMSGGEKRELVQSGPQVQGHWEESAAK